MHKQGPGCCIGIGRSLRSSAALFCQSKVTRLMCAIWNEVSLDSSTQRTNKHLKIIGIESKLLFDINMALQSSAEFFITFFGVWRIYFCSHVFPHHQNTERDGAIHTDTLTWEDSWDDAEWDYIWASHCHGLKAYFHEVYTDVQERRHCSLQPSWQHKTSTLSQTPVCHQTLSGKRILMLLS